MTDAIKGLILGGILGALTGLGTCIWIIDGTWLFPGDTIVIGAAVCGSCGFLFGDRFFEFMGDNWRWFT